VRLVEVLVIGFGGEFVFRRHDPIKTLPGDVVHDE
jgi:hypothetical protein